MEKNYFLLLFFLSITSFYIAQNLGSGLVGKWLFSGNALDSSGNGNHGIVTCAELSNDCFNTQSKSYYFTSDGWIAGSLLNQIYIPYSSSPVCNNLTVSAWKKPLSYAYDAAIVHRYEQGYSNPNGEVFRMFYI